MQNPLKIKIEEEGITLKETADRLGVSKATVSNWIKERTKPSHGYYPALAEFLGISIIQAKRIFHELNKPGGDDE